MGNIVPRFNYMRRRISKRFCRAGVTLQQQYKGNLQIIQDGWMCSGRAPSRYNGEAVVTSWPYKAKLRISGQAAGAYCLWLKQKTITGTLGCTQVHGVIPRAWRCACKSDQNSAWQVYGEQCVWPRTHIQQLFSPERRVFFCLYSQFNLFISLSLFLSQLHTSHWSVLVLINRYWHTHKGYLPSDFFLTTDDG